MAAEESNSPSGSTPVAEHASEATSPAVPQGLRFRASGTANENPGNFAAFGGRNQRNQNSNQGFGNRRGNRRDDDFNNPAFGSMRRRDGPEGHGFAGRPHDQQAPPPHDDIPQSEAPMPAAFSGKSDISRRHETGSFRDNAPPLPAAFSAGKHRSGSGFGAPPGEPFHDNPAFGGSRNRNRDRENPGIPPGSDLGPAFGSGSRQRGDRGPAPASDLPAAFTSGPKIRGPDNRGPMEHYNNPSFGSSSNRNQNPPGEGNTGFHRRGRDRDNNFPSAFGGGPQVQQREGFDSDAPNPFGGRRERGERPERGGGRFGGRDRLNNRPDVDLSGFTGNKASLSDLIPANIKTRKGNWAEDSDDEAPANPAAANNTYVPPMASGAGAISKAKAKSTKAAAGNVEPLAPEIITGEIYKLVKDFSSELNLKRALETIKSKLVGQKYEAQLVQELITKSRKLEFRDKKPFVNMIQTMKEQSLVSSEDIAEGINNYASKLLSNDIYKSSLSSQKHAVLVSFEEYFKLLESKDLFEDSTFNDDLRAIVTPRNEVISKHASLIESLVSSPHRGENLVSLASNPIELMDQKELLAFVSEIFKEILSQKKEEIKVDAAAVWLGNSVQGYGTLLAFIFNKFEAAEKDETSDINKDLIRTEVFMIYSLQKLFASAELNFPKTSAGESLLEQCFMQMYDFLSDKAFIYWKQNVFNSDNDFGGKEKAIEETLQFFEFLDQQREEEPEEDDGEEEDDQ